MNNLKVLIIFSLIIFQVNIIFSSDFNFLNHFQSETSITDKLSYELTNFENLQENDEFKLEIYKNEKLIDDSCVKKIDFDAQTFYKKITCETQKLENGNFVLVGQILRDGKQIKKTITKKQILEDVSSTLNYQILENQTKIEIEVTGAKQNLQIIHEIPKEIIALITEENKDKVLTAKQDFIIIEADPIIAWNIEQAPETIEYTINKKADEKDLNNMKVEIKENSSYKYLTYVVYLLVILIIGIVLKPIFKKNSK